MLYYVLLRFFEIRILQQTKEGENALEARVLNSSIILWHKITRPPVLHSSAWGN
jgi:hypothetical protein